MSMHSDVARWPATGDDHVELRRRIEAFQFDDATASLTFSARLARENGWPQGYALRVLEEYKRFLYLAMTAGHEVTPSDEVDQAWHLHLTYTHSYWGVLCRDILRAPLHHGPTKGGSSEGERFEDQYEQTLASYRAAFAEAPPADIWPPAAQRFGDAPHFIRVNTRRVKVTPRNRIVGRLRARPVLLGGLVVIGAAGLTPVLPLAELMGPGGWFWIAIVVLIAYAVYKAATGGGSGGSGCAAAGGGFFGGDGGGSGCGGSGCGGGGCGGCGG
ncbi:MAG: hypothetical protein AAF589_00100 [Planctomycetota bacterium]